MTKRFPTWREQQRAIEEKKAIEEGARQALDHWTCSVCSSFNVTDIFTAVNHSRHFRHVVRSREAGQARKNIAHRAQVEEAVARETEHRKREAENRKRAAQDRKRAA